MPKLKKPVKNTLNMPNRKGDLQSSVLSDDGESFIENESVYSYNSSAKWDCASDDRGLDDDRDTENVDDNQSQLGGNYIDDFEDKLKDAIDGTGNKSAKTRVMCLEAIKKALITRYCWEFVMNRKVTFVDILERSIKRKGEELGSSAILSAVVCITMGVGEETDHLFHELQGHLSASLADNCVPPAVRSKCAIALALGCFITTNGLDILQSTMNLLQTTFAGSFFKGNGAIPSHSPEISSLHASALYSWTLLITTCDRGTVNNLVDKFLKRITQLLESPDVELRIAAGECIAVLHEIVREGDQDFELDDIDELCDKLRALATDSQKFRAKKDRRQQRNVFRYVLREVEENEPPNIHYKFGRERLTIDTWSTKRQYDAFCYVLKSGMNLHLAENPLLREIFGLGPIRLEPGLGQKISKFERNMGNIAADKLRTKQRSKLRDKRADVI